MASGFAPPHHCGFGPPIYYPRTPMGFLMCCWLNEQDATRSRCGQTSCWCFILCDKNRKEDNMDGMWGRSHQDGDSSLKWLWRVERSFLRSGHISSRHQGGRTQRRQRIGPPSGRREDLSASAVSAWTGSFPLGKLDPKPPWNRATQIKLSSIQSELCN